MDIEDQFFDSKFFTVLPPLRLFTSKLDQLEQGPLPVEYYRTYEDTIKYILFEPFAEELGMKG